MIKEIETERDYKNILLMEKVDKWIEKLADKLLNDPEILKSSDNEPNVEVVSDDYAVKAIMYNYDEDTDECKYACILGFDENENPYFIHAGNDEETGFTYEEMFLKLKEELLDDKSN